MCSEAQQLRWPVVLCLPFFMAAEHINDGGGLPGHQQLLSGPAFWRLGMCPVMEKLLCLLI